MASVSSAGRALGWSVPPTALWGLADDVASIDEAHDWIESMSGLGSAHMLAGRHAISVFGTAALDVPGDALAAMDAGTKRTVEAAQPSSGFARFLAITAEASAEAAGAEAARAEEETQASIDEGGVEGAGFVAAMFSNQILKLAEARIRRGGR